MKKLRPVSLSEKLILNFMFLGITAIVILGTFSYRHARNAFEKKIVENLDVIRDNNKETIESSFGLLTYTIQELVNTPEFQNNIIAQKFSENNSTNQFTLNDLIATESTQQIKDFMISSGIIFEEPDKLKIVSTNNALITDTLYEQLLKKATEKDLRKHNILCDVNNKMGIVVLYRDSIQKIGHFSLLLNLSSGFLFENRANKVKLVNQYEPVRIFIAGQNGIIERVSIADTSYMQCRPIESVKVFLDKELTEGNLIRTTSKGNKVISTYSRLNTNFSDLILVVETDFNKAMIPIFGLYQKIVGLIILLSLVFFIFVFITSRKITSPLLRLRESVKKIGDGDFDTTVIVDSTDEIGELSYSVRRMAEKLNKQKSEIAGERFRRLKTMFDSQELERQRLSKELHESLGQTLAAVRLKLNGIDCKDEESKQKLEDLNRLTDSIINQIRFISNNLSPTVLAEFGLPVAIRHLVNEINDNYSTNIRFQSSDFSYRLPSKLRIYLFRITEEALLNAIKNNQNKEIFISLNHSKTEISLKISNSPVDIINAPSLRDMSNIRERVELLHGTIRFEETASLGSIMTILIPFKENKK